MGQELAKKVGNSGAEEQFIQLFCEVFGPEKGQYVYLQYPFLDIYGGHRTIDFAMNTSEGRIAVEVDGNTWHSPARVSEYKYHDDLLKQNSMVHEGWKVYRWTSSQLDHTPERIKDELVTFLGPSPKLSYIDDTLPQQRGKAFALKDHQAEALKNLETMRQEHQSIALLYEATGTGKTVTAVSDAKAVGSRTLMLAHTKELVSQAAEQFRRLWPEVTVGCYTDGQKEASAHVVCGTIQSVERHLEDFSPEDFGYLIIDECHHGTAETYRRILSYFHPLFTLGLTATPERTDGEDILSIFQNVAHKLDIQTAVENGVLVPVRCIRVKTNIDLSDVRISGFRYNSLDLETRMMIPDRNRLIVATYLEYVRDQSAVVFCTSVAHAEEVARLFREAGVEARAVSGTTTASERKRILRGYEEGKITVLCACDLLNEGWDSPHTQVLFMARPTMSKTIYMQQLGRGMRLCENKDFLMVFDFVDNANMFNCPYSLHRLFNVREYYPGALVLGRKQGLAWDHELFKRGEKPAVLIDYPVHATDYELIDLFNWQDEAREMLSQQELTRRVSTQSETIERYIRDGRIIPDLEVPISEHKKFRYFRQERPAEYAKRFGWKLITPSNRKALFFEMAETMTMSMSYKPVFILSFLEHMNENGEARIADVAETFADFYEERRERGLAPERKKCIFTRGAGQYDMKDVERLILSMPFKRFEDMHFMHHAKHLGIIQLDRWIVKQLSGEDITYLRTCCKRALQRYFGSEL